MEPPGTHTCSSTPSIRAPSNAIHSLPGRVVLFDFPFTQPIKQRGPTLHLHAKTGRANKGVLVGYPTNTPIATGLST